MTLSKSEIQERIEEGSVRALVTFEFVGKPQKHVNDTLSTYVQKLEEDPGITVLKVQKADAAELEDQEGFFSAFSEVEMLVPQLESLTHLSVNLMPASIEILEPDEFTFSARELMNWENDLLARLHEISQAHREERQKVQYLAKNMHALIHNSISFILASGPKTAAIISQLTGVPEERIVQSLEEFKEQGVVSQEGEEWQLISKTK